MLIFDTGKASENIVFFDLREKCDFEERQQRGQYGDASHTMRIYKKRVAIIPEQIQAEVIHAIEGSGDMPPYAECVSRAEVAKLDYNLAPSRYVSNAVDTSAHRELADIVDDLNRVVRNRNVLKLTMNVTAARGIGILGLEEDQAKSNACTDKLRPFIEKLTGKRLLKSDFFVTTKDRNVFKFENKDPEIVSEIILSILQMWKAHIMFLNNEENRYLEELRDALLPKLMSGEIQVDANEGGG